MDIATISNWLLTHGFSTIGSRSFEGDYAGHSVRVALHSNGGCVSAHKNSRRREIATFRLGRLWMDGHGMLRGAGLDDFFAERMRAGNPAPRWFPEGFRRAVYRNAEWAAIPVDELPNAERAMRWASDNGFTMVGPRTFQADYADSTVEFHVGTTEVVTHMVTGRRRELLMRKPVRSIRFDSTGMIIGAGLDARFVEEMKIGGEPPIWFNARYIKALDSGRARPSMR